MKYSHSKAMAVFYKIEGALSDIAPTLLLMMGVEQPDEMTGSSLITFK
jgi:bisphosphoglycerate-independent phosphoglycerate mutase (AlkP superfamily)